MTYRGMRHGDQCRNDLFGIPTCFYWSIDEVADWIESIGYGKYKEHFRSHFINGRRLLTVDACTLPKMGIVHFGDIMTLAKCIKNVLGKGPKIPHFNPRPRPQVLEDTKQKDSWDEYICAWRSWLPQYFYGYDPERRPLDREDFQNSWWLTNCRYKYSHAPGNPWD